MSSSKGNEETVRPYTPGTIALERSERALKNSRCLQRDHSRDAAELTATELHQNSKLSTSTSIIF